MTASERRRAIFEKLCVNRRATRENLAFEFGVSTRTVERDVLTLSLHYPVFTLRGSGGGIFIEDWYSSDKEHLTEEQAELLKRISKQLVGYDAKIMRDILNRFYSKK